MAASPAPHPGPGTQEVLSKRLGDECPASLFCGLASILLLTRPPSSGTRSEHVCMSRTHMAPHTTTVCVCAISPRVQASSLPSDWGPPIPWADLPTSWPLWVMLLPTLGGRLQEASPPLSSQGPPNFPPASLTVWHPLRTPLGRRDFPLPFIPSASGGTGFITSC